MATKEFNKAAVTENTINEFKAAAAGLKEGYKHFLNGFRLAAEDICKDFGGFENLESPKDQKAVFNLIREIAQQQVGLSPKTFDRYCKIARYCLIYHVSWEIGSEATRQQLRWCRDRIKSFKNGSKEEKMGRAWEERVKLDKAEADDKKKKEAERLAEIGFAEPAEKQTLLQIPLPKDGQDEDAYWMEYLAAQVAHIQKNMPILNGGSAVKTVVLNFLGQALPIVKAAKAKPVKKEAA